jgi:hypothetical protein
MGKVSDRVSDSVISVVIDGYADSYPIGSATADYLRSGTDLSGSLPRKVVVKPT